MYCTFCTLYHVFMKSTTNHVWLSFIWIADTFPFFSLLCFTNLNSLPVLMIMILRTETRDNSECHPQSQPFMHMYLYLEYVYMWHFDIWLYTFQRTVYTIRNIDINIKAACTTVGNIYFWALTILVYTLFKWDWRLNWRWQGRQGIHFPLTLFFLRQISLGFFEPCSVYLFYFCFLQILQ